MTKKILFTLVVISCVVSLLSLIRVLSRRMPSGISLQAAATNSNVSVKVKSGSLTFSQLPIPSVNPVDTSTEDQTTTGTLGVIEVADLRGAKGTGWTVNTDAMTPYENADKSDSIAFTNTKLSVKNLVVSKGDPLFVSISNGILIPTDVNNDKVLDSAITLAQTQGEVNGKKYNGVNIAKFTTDITLVVPGGLPADTYTSTYIISVQ